MAASATICKIEAWSNERQGQRGNATVGDEEVARGAQGRLDDCPVGRMPASLSPARLPGRQLVANDPEAVRPDARGEEPQPVAPPEQDRPDEDQWQPGIARERGCRGRETRRRRPPRCDQTQRERREDEVKGLGEKVQVGGEHGRGECVERTGDDPGSATERLPGESPDQDHAREQEERIQEPRAVVAASDQLEGKRVDRRPPVERLAAVVVGLRKRDRRQVVTRLHVDDRVVGHAEAPRTRCVEQQPGGGEADCRKRHQREP